MADKYEDLLLLGAAACCTYVLRKKKRKRRPRFWIHPVIANRNDQGDYQHLIQELRSDPALFRRYFRLSVEQFDDLLGLVEHRIRLMNTPYIVSDILIFIIFICIVIYYTMHCNGINKSFRCLRVCLRVIHFALTTDVISSKVTIRDKYA